MGHLLSTTNPEAAARLQAEGDAGVKRPIVSNAEAKPAPAPPVAPLKAPYDGYMPEVGEIVHYNARPGEGRAGKTVFPAIMMHCDEQTGHAQLFIIYASDDFSDRVNIPARQSEGQYMTWSPLKRNGGAMVMRESGAIEPVDQSENIAELAKRLNDAEKAIMGLARQFEKIEPSSAQFGKRQKD